MHNDIPSKMNSHYFKFSTIYRITRLKDNTEWFSTSISRLYKMTLISIGYINYLIENNVEIFVYEGVKYSFRKSKI